MVYVSIFSGLRTWLVPSFWYDYVSVGGANIVVSSDDGKFMKGGS